MARRDRAGAEAAFEALYAEHGDAVLRYARRRTTGTADDVVAETFLVAWRRLEHVPSHPRGWLIGVARRVLANERRGDRRRDALAERIAAEPAHAPPPVATDDGVATALAQLGERDREALLLVHWDELSPADAARALGVTGIAFRSRLHRARRRLAAQLENDPTRSPHATAETTGARP